MGYTWNLIERFPNQLVFEVHELDESDRVSRVELSSQVRFARSPRSETTTNQGLLFRDSVLELRACVVEHHIPVLAYSLRERAHIGVNKSKLSGLGLDTGAWLSRVKRALQQDREQARQLLEALYPELAPEAVLRCFIEERGEHLGYVVDTAYHPRCRDRLAAILSEANHLFLEARFLEEDRDRAAERAHLSTTQCAELARELRAKRLTPIHFSTRNEGQSARFIEEVMRSFLAPEPN
jgi:ribonuclease Z